MTRKDYIVIAKILNAQYNSAKTVDELQLVSVTINDFIVSLKADNARFDSNKFFNACTQAA